MAKEYDILNDEPQMANEPTAAYKMWILLLYYLPTWCRYWIVSQGWGAKKSWSISVWRDFMLGKYCLCVSGYKKKKRGSLSASSFLGDPLEGSKSNATTVATLLQSGFDENIW